MILYETFKTPEASIVDLILMIGFAIGTLRLFTHFTMIAVRKLIVTEDSVGKLVDKRLQSERKKAKEIINSDRDPINNIDTFEVSKSQKKNPSNSKTEKKGFVTQFLDQQDDLLKTENEQYESRKSKHLGGFCIERQEFPDYLDTPAFLRLKKNQ